MKFIGAIFWLVAIASPCSTDSNPADRHKLFTAELIVRVVAEEYAVPPSFRVAPPEGLIRFKVLETIKGPLMPTVALPGELVGKDMFSPEKPPYTRAAHAGGTCFSSFYSVGGQYLLFLNTNEAGHFTANWFPVAPINEQLHSDKDPWLLWVREQAHKAFQAEYHR